MKVYVDVKLRPVPQPTSSKDQHTSIKIIKYISLALLLGFVVVVLGMLVLERRRR